MTALRNIAVLGDTGVSHASVTARLLEGATSPVLLLPTGASA